MWVVLFISTRSTRTFHTASVHVLPEKAAHYMPDSAGMCVRSERERVSMCVKVFFFSSEGFAQSCSTSVGKQADYHEKRASEGLMGGTDSGAHKH